MPEGYVSRPRLAADLALYLSLFWILSASRNPSFGSTPGRIPFSEIGACYDRCAADVTDFDTFRDWIIFLDGEYCRYMTPKEDRDKSDELLREIHRGNSDIPIWT